jgi:hypothetical protein
MDWSIFWDAVLSLVPPALVGVLFWIMMRSILRADRTERKVYSEIEAELRAEAEAKAKAADE